MQIWLNQAVYQYNSLHPQVKGEECYIIVLKSNGKVFDIIQEAWIIIKP